MHFQGSPIHTFARDLAVEKRPQAARQMPTDPVRATGVVRSGVAPIAAIAVATILSSVLTSWAAPMKTGQKT